MLEALDDRETEKDVGKTFAELGNLVVHSKRDVTMLRPCISWNKSIEVI